MTTGSRLKAKKILYEVLQGAGNSEIERLFRMNITMCLHRAMTYTEARDLPQWWHDAPAVDLAGGPIEILEQRGIVEERPSVRPCENPKREKIHPSAAERLWIPADCGVCEPCLDRIAIREEAISGIT